MTISPITSTADPVCEVPRRRLPLHERVVLFRWRGLTVATFGLFAALGGAAGAVLVLARMHQAGLDVPRFAPTMFVLVPLLAVAGARLFSSS